MSDEKLTNHDPEVDKPEVVPPRAPLREYLAEVADLGMLPALELRTLLGQQLDLLAIKTNHAALRVSKELASKELNGKEREARIKELMGYGMFADSISRQRAALGKEIAMTTGGDAERGRPTVEIPETLDDKSWEEKYGSKFLGTTALKKTN